MSKDGTKLMNDDLDDLFKELADVNKGKFSGGGYSSSLDQFLGGGGLSGGNGKYSVLTHRGS